MKQKFFLLIILSMGLQACVKANSAYDWDPSWNKPPSEKAQSPKESGTTDMYYQQMKDDKKKESQDQYFEKFYERNKTQKVKKK
ncbi:MAG: hypothetical protein IPJ69_14650 [Deltaproteobacteria bacterium]|nr:MAG: hypothetical protein IPJ69_14650 [Deltaproteobacteria bacterium]